MGFRTRAYATVWETKKGNGNYTDARISISKKDKRTDQYVTDFSGFVRLVGAAHQSAGNLKERDRIKIGDCEVTNSYNKEKNTTYTNYAIFNYEDASGNGSNQNSANDFATMAPPDEDDLPFA